MDNAASVSLDQGCGYINDNADSALEAEFTLLHQLAKRSPFGEFHNKKGPAFFGFTIVKERCNTRMVQLGNRARLAQETSAIVMRIRT